MLDLILHFKEEESIIPMSYKTFWYLGIVLSRLPFFKPTHSLLDKDDLVGDGVVPLYLQLHVVVILKGDKVANKDKKIS